MCIQMTRSRPQFQPLSTQSLSQAHQQNQPLIPYSWTSCRSWTHPGEMFFLDYKVHCLHNLRCMYSFSLPSLFVLSDDWQSRSDSPYRISVCLLLCLFCPAYSTAGEVIGLLNDYLFSELPLDIESVRKGATSLHHLKRTLGTACQGLHRSVCFAFTVNDEPRVKSRSNLCRLL